MKHFILIFSLILGFSGMAQVKDSLYDTDLLPASFHKGRREAFRAQMAPGSMAVVFAAPERNRSNDDDFQYHQDPNFYYLTGLNEPNSVLILFKEEQGIDSVVKVNEILYLQAREPMQESWTGRLLGVDGAKKRLGFTSVFVNTRFDNPITDYKKFSKIYHSLLHDDVRKERFSQGGLFELIEAFGEKTKLLQSKDPSGFTDIMSSLREIKTPEEIVLMRKAINISCLAHLELMKSLQPKMTEYQAQAIIEYGFKANGSEYVAYPSIVGAGENACILHYETNRKKCVPGDIMVIDAGAEYHGYAADVTRSLPVSGKFTEEQKSIYNLVLKAQIEGIKACKEGNPWSATQSAAADIIGKGLVELGIIKERNDFRKYFFHGTSHYLGLDVHDAGNYGRYKPGMVITVEPGIYIPKGSPCDKKWWNIGVRIEDDILITSGEPDVLSGKLPRTIEEIEKTMGERGLFKK